MRGDRVRLFAGMLLTTALVTGCAVPPQPGQSTGQVSTQSIEQLLAQAERSQPIRAAELRLQAAQIAERQGDQNRVATILGGLDIALLPPNLRFDIARLQAGAAINRRDSGNALRLLNPAQFADLTPTQTAELSRLRAEAYDQQSNPLAAAMELISVARNQTGEQQQTTHEQIWNLLQQADSEALVAASFNNYGFYEQGWVELALSLSKQGDLSTQRDALLQWQQLWDSHPAIQNPPRSLAALLNADLLVAKRILVALPFSQNYAKPAQMISEGVAAARYTRSSQGLPVPELITVDTEQFNNAAELLNHAQAIQADLVIGPLKPELIDQLAALAPLPIPMISFNQANVPTEGLYQLDLSSDLEIEQLIERAMIEGAQRFALITPAAPWGLKIKEDYMAALEAKGAQLVASLDYQPGGELSDQISQLLNTDRSKARYGEVRRILGQKLEFDERPRRDIDAILMTAQPQDARQIKPMLAFHFAGGYPVYATSHLYEGDPNPTRDVDLNGISFPDLPWTLNPDNALHLRLASERPDTYTRLGRLYALGADAFNLHPYLRQLAGSQGIYVDGETGSLSMNATGRVLRTLTWAQFDQGAPVLLGPPMIPTDEMMSEMPETR